MTTDYGLAVSLSGYDIKTATLQQLAFSSKYPLLKVIYSGSLSITIPINPNRSPTDRGTASTSFAHNLGYIPMFRAFSYYNPPTNTYKKCTDVHILVSSKAIDVETRIDATNLTVQGQNYDTVNQFTISVFYYIYVDPGS